MKTIATESIYEEIIEAAAAWWVKNLHHLHVCKNLLEQKEDKHTFKEGLVDFLQKQSERMEMVTLENDFVRTNVLETCCDDGYFDKRSLPAYTTMWVNLKNGTICVLTGDHAPLTQIFPVAETAQEITLDSAVSKAGEMKIVA